MIVDAEAPENFSLRSVDAETTEPGALDRLDEGYDVLARSKDTDLLLRLLVRRLDDHAGHDEDHLIALNAVAFCSDRDAVLLPAITKAALPRLAKLFRDNGYSWTGRTPRLAPESCELVVPEIGIAVDSEELGGPGSGPTSKARPPGADQIPASGRYPLRSCLLHVPDQRADADVHRVDEDLLPHLLALVEDPHRHDLALVQRALGAVLARVHIHAGAVAEGSLRTLVNRLTT